VLINGVDVAHSDPYESTYTHDLAVAPGDTIELRGWYCPAGLTIAGLELRGTIG